MLVVVLIGQGFSCRAQVLENDLFRFENPLSLYTTVGGPLSASQAKYSMVVGKKNNSIPMVNYFMSKDLPFPFWGKNSSTDSAIIDYYFGNRSKVYIVAWRGKDRRTDLVDNIYKTHRDALISGLTVVEKNRNEVVYQPSPEEVEEKVTFMGDTEALHRTLIMKLSQTSLILLVPPMDFYYDLYQFYDSKADATVIALFYRIEINPDMRREYPGEFSDTMLLDFEKYFKLKSNAPSIIVLQPMVPPLFKIYSPKPRPKPQDSTVIRLPEKTGEIVIVDPPVPDPEPKAPVLKRSIQTTVSMSVSGREVLQFAEDSRSLYILYKRSSLLAIDKQSGDKREVVTGYEAMDVTGVAVDRKGRLLLYTGRGLLRWNGKSIATSPVIFKYDGYTGRNSKVTVTSAGNLLVYGGGSSSPTVLLSEDGELMASSEKLRGDRVLMMSDGMIWASTTSKLVSGHFSGVPVEHSYGDKWSNLLSGLADMCPHGNDLLVCGSKLFVFRNGQWETLYIPKGLYLTNLAVDKRNNIWLVSNEGLMCMGKDGKEPVKILTSIMTPKGKKDLGYIKGLYVDTAGNLWIVTLSDVIVHNPGGLMGLLP